MIRAGISRRLRRCARAALILLALLGSASISASVARGEALVSAGGGRTTQCPVCHGADLTGLALVPPPRGRSPTYIARQLVDFKPGSRHGAWAPLMGPVVENLTADDILDIAAYLASLPPRP